MNILKKYPRAYSAWSNMKSKCKKDGIRYAEAWERSSGFIKDMGEPDEGMSLRRKDENKEFCKENCFWERRGLTHYDPRDKAKYPGAFRSWKAMHQRCKGLSYWAKDRYSERGIEVCQSWYDFSNFVADMGERPENLSLDRIDNDKGYSKDNCRWATQSIQVANRSEKDKYWERGDFVAKSESTILWRMKHWHLSRKEVEQIPLRSFCPCYCKETGEEFASLVDASKKTGRTYKTIKKACETGCEVKGLHFAYKSSSNGV